MRSLVTIKNDGIKIIERVVNHCWLGMQEFNFMSVGVSMIGKAFTLEKNYE
jgi:hypothetical protein